MVLTEELVNEESNRKRYAGPRMYTLNLIYNTGSTTDTLMGKRQTF